MMEEMDTSEITRKLASVRLIEAIDPIQGADAIELATVDGWRVIVRKTDGFQVGSKAVYFEIDSVLPLAPVYEERGLKRNSYERREWLPNGEGFRLRTAKIRGVLSQGLLLPYDGKNDIGHDLTEELGIIKWDPPAPVHLRGKQRGNFPQWARKSDETRCQNLKSQIREAFEMGLHFEVSIKLDGTSMTCAIRGDDFHICTRNNSMKTDQTGNAYVDTAKALNLEEKIRGLKRNLSFGGELLGPGIQANKEGLKDFQWFVFNIYDVDRQMFLSPEERLKICQSLGIWHVPIIHVGPLPSPNIDDLLIMAEGKSLNADMREGIVFKSLDGAFSFKAISNAWLQRHKE